MAKSILIVDDEVEITDEMHSFLTEEGYHTLGVYAAKDALEAIRKNQFDLLILDLKLPDISGLDVLRLCRDVSPRTKVLAMTGYVDQNIFDEAERIGYEGFLQKPFDFDSVLAEVRRVLGEDAKPKQGV